MSRFDKSLLKQLQFTLTKRGILAMNTSPSFKSGIKEVF